MMKRIVGKYQLGETIGKGAYSEVYKAKHSQQKEVYAIKVISNKLLLGNTKVKECITNQINTHNLIGQSDHIVKFKQLLQTKNNCYFVYEYCEGGTLHQYIVNNKHLSQQKALDIFDQVLQAFKVLKKFKVMHRDVKPENILMKNGVFKLADFGFCKQLNNEASMTSTMLGSPLYMAPQVLRGEAYTSNADIWSLGVILYQMLYGFCPFESSSIAKLINKIDESDVRFPSEINSISDATKSLIKKILQKDQSKRIKWEQLFEKERHSHKSPKKIIFLPYYSQIISKSSNKISEEVSAAYLQMKNDKFSSLKSEMKDSKMKSKFEVFKENYDKNKLDSIKNGRPIVQNLSTKNSNQRDFGHETNYRISETQFFRDRSQTHKNIHKITESKELGLNNLKYEMVVKKHELCWKALKCLLSLLQSRNSKFYKFIKPILRTMKAQLQKIYSKINLNDTQMFDALSIMKYEAIQLQKIILQVQSEFSKLESNIFTDKIQQTSELPEQIRQFWSHSNKEY